MINVENITKSFGAQSLFEGVSFKLNHRERLGVVGRNGHGKTTLFRMIIGKDHPDSGTITIPKITVLVMSGSIWTLQKIRC